MIISPEAQARPSWFDAMAVYFKPRVLIVLLLGFSAGLPFSLAGQTLQAWMTESGVDIKTIGLFAAVGTPYWAKPLWAPAVDALDVPLLSRLLGRRRAWLILTQLMLIVSIVLLALCEPAISPWLVAGAALLVTTASATQDIVIDAFRIESLPENEQAAGMASYVAAYRIAVLISGAGALFLVTGFIQFGLGKQAAYHATYIAMATLIGVGIVATLLAKEPNRSAAAESDHTAHSREKSWKRVWDTAIASFSEFLSRDMAIAILAFVTLFKFADSLASALTTPFVLETGSRESSLPPSSRASDLPQRSPEALPVVLWHALCRWPPACGSAESCKQSQSSPFHGRRSWAVTWPGSLSPSPPKTSPAGSER